MLKLFKKNADIQDLKVFGLRFKSFFQDWFRDGSGCEKQEILFRNGIGCVGNGNPADEGKVQFQNAVHRSKLTDLFLDI